MNRCKRETGNHYTAYTPCIKTPRGFVAESLYVAGRAYRIGWYEIARALLDGARSIRQISIDPLP